MLGLPRLAVLPGRCYSKLIFDIFLVIFLESYLRLDRKHLEGGVPVHFHFDRLVSFIEIAMLLRFSFELRPCIFANEVFSLYI